MLEILNNKMVHDMSKRKLVKTYQGMPEGAGIYDDGKFYNCAPDQAPQEILYMDDECYLEDIETGKIAFKKDHPNYLSTKAGMLLAGADIDLITTKDEFERAISIAEYGEYILEYLMTKKRL